MIFSIFSICYSCLTHSCLWFSMFSYCLTDLIWLFSTADFLHTWFIFMAMWPAQTIWNPILCYSNLGHFSLIVAVCWSILHLTQKLCMTSWSLSGNFLWIGIRTWQTQYHQTTMLSLQVTYLLLLLCSCRSVKGSSLFISVWYRPHFKRDIMHHGPQKLEMSV